MGRGFYTRCYGVSCYEHTRDQGTLGSITIPVIVEPLGGHFLYTYRLGHIGGYFSIWADHVIRLIDRSTSRSDDQGDLVMERSNRPRSIEALI
jgi:hypothetical protein